MIELEGTIFEPPTGTSAICIPVACAIKDGASVMKHGYALQAKLKFRGVDKAIGYFTRLIGARTHILTYDHRAENGDIDGAAVHGAEGKQLLPWHILSFPTRKTWEDAPNLDLIIKSARELKHLVEMKEQLRSGRIALPRLGQGSADALGWVSLKKQLDIWLDEDRYIVLTGNTGTIS